MIYTPRALPGARGFHLPPEWAEGFTMSKGTQEAHTKGPWKVSEYTDTSGEVHAIVGTDYPESLCNGARSIASMTGGYYTIPGESFKPEVLAANRANAQLISAAPELLEACRAALEYTIFGGDIQKKVSAAIAKAGGGA